MAPYLRLRQLCLVAHDLEPVVDDLCAVFGIEVCHRDPNVGKYGLVNALMPVGTSFIEVVSPIKTGGDTAAGRYLDRRGGDGGYMVINDCDDVARRRNRAAALGIRIIEDREYPGKAHLLQLHPRDTGGCMLEFDHHTGGEALDGNYQWAGPHWQRHVRTERALAITGVEMQSDHPKALAERWSAMIERPLAHNGDGIPSISLDNAGIRFVEAHDGRGEGLGGIDIRVRDAAPVIDAASKRGLAVWADSVTIGGTRFKLRAGA